MSTQPGSATGTAADAGRQADTRRGHKRYIRPTPRAVMYFAATIPVAVIVVVCMESWFFSIYLPAAVLALILADILMALPDRSLDAELRFPARMHVGQAGTARVKLLAHGYSRPLPIQALLELSGEVDMFEAPAPDADLMVEGGLELELQIVPRRRGKINVDALWLRWRGHLGMVEMRRRQPVGRVLDVVQDVNGIHEAALQFFSHDAVYGVKTQRMRGEGTEFDTLCEYSQGMDSRFIDWKRSARHRKLLCKEFRQERNNQIVFGFDVGHLMLEPIAGMPKLDHAVKAGLLLAWISLYSGDLVGGCGFDARFRHFIRPGRGMPHFTQFQRFTAGLDYRTEETNFTLGLAELNARLQRRALVVLFTEFVDAVSAELLIESLQHMSRKHLVVFVTMKDPMLGALAGAAPGNFKSVAEAVIADDFLRERSIVLERVARLGVHCLDVPVQGISSALLNRYLLIKQRGLL